MCAGNNARRRAAKGRQTKKAGGKGLRARLKQRIKTLRSKLRNRRKK